jgi:hypothetical protein
MHADHVTGTGRLKQFFPNCKSVIAKYAAAKADWYIDGGDIIKFGKFALECRSTPGHTDGKYFIEFRNEYDTYFVDFTSTHSCVIVPFNSLGPTALSPYELDFLVVQPALVLNRLRADRTRWPVTPRQIN